MSPLPATVPDSNPWIGANGIALVIPENASTTTVDLPDAPFESPVLDTNVGTAEEVHTESAPIDVTKSFTLSMWVKAGHVPTTNSEVIAMQDGSTLGHIQLQVTSTGKFAFCLGDAFANMSSTALTSNCATGGTVTPGTWQMVTGIWDAVNQQLRIHVGNDITPVGSVSHVPGAGVASGGSALYFGPNPDTGRFRGLIANPMALPGVANSNQLGQMAGFFLPFS
nr:LamG-like jellyroll fold domain-containing protein [Microbacterium esteraromaticum]